MCSVICAMGPAGSADVPGLEVVTEAVVPVDDYSNSAVSAAIDEWIHSERDRAILKRRLIDGLTYECLAEEFDMSVRQIKSIVYKGQERVFSRM